jgi:hypothetical protein
MKPRVLRLSSRLYAVMLRAYPSSFRCEYSREMMLLFEDRAHDAVERGGSWALVPFMLHIVWDWLQTVARERKDEETNSALIARINRAAGTPYPDPDRQSRAVCLMLTAVGAVLLVVGWSRWMNLK